jgi:hypothetical protein
MIAPDRPFGGFYEKLLRGFETASPSGGWGAGDLAVRL